MLMVEDKIKKIEKLTEKYTEICRNVSADVIKMVDNHRKKQLSRKKRNTHTEDKE